MPSHWGIVGLRRGGPYRIHERLQAITGTDVTRLAVRCNAGYREVTPGRVNSRNGYRRRERDTRAGTIELAIPKLRSAELDELAEGSRSRPPDGGPYTFCWIDALNWKVREGGRTVNVHCLIAAGVNAAGYREILGIGSWPRVTGVRDPVRVLAVVRTSAGFGWTGRGVLSGWVAASQLRGR